MIVLKKVCFVVIVLIACLFCSFLARKDFLLAQELKEGKVLEAQELKEGKVIKKDAVIKSDSIFAPKKRIQLKAEKAIPKAKEAVLKEVKPDGIEVIESRPIPKAEEPILIEPKLIELKPIKLEPLKEIKEVKFEATGYYGEPIIFSSRSIFKLIILEEELYSVGDYLTSQGILGYDRETKLNYIDIVKIDKEEVSANTYIKLYFKEPPSIPLGTCCEIRGIVGKIFSQDRIYLDEIRDLKEVSIDREHIIERCASSIRNNLAIIISAPIENEGLRNWMSEEYGISTLSKDQILEVLDNVKLIEIDYDFFDQIAMCTFSGNPIVTRSKGFRRKIILECLYNSDSEMVDKIIISFRKI